MRDQLVWAAVAVAAVTVFVLVYLGPIPVRAALLVGGVSEAIGFGLTFWDLVETQRRVLRFSKGPRDIAIRTLPVRVDLTTGWAHLTADAPPLEERVAALERTQHEVFLHIQEALANARKEAEELARQHTEIVRQEAADEASRLGELISGITLGGMRYRQWGVALFVIGLAAATAANLVGQEAVAR